MSTYIVELKNSKVHEVVSQRVITQGGFIHFCNDNGTSNEQFFYGDEVVAAFNIDDVSFFKKGTNHNE